jgi:hypothetical protein
LRRLVPALFILLLSFLIVPTIITPAYASEPQLVEIFSNLGFTNIAEADAETFPAGTYDITLYAEFAGYHDENELSYYEVGKSTYNLIFDGPEGGFECLSMPVNKTITADHQFGLSIFTPDDYRYFTENNLNPDGENHAIIYKNLDDPKMFLIGFEDLYEAGDMDYQDLVFSLEIQPPQPPIPEVPFGTLLSVLSMLVALLGFAGFKRFRARPK